MPADRPSHRPGPAPDGSSYQSDGEWAQTRNEVGNPRGGSAPTRAEHVYPEGGGALRGRGAAGNRRVRHALTRAERFSFEGGQGPGRRPGGRNWESEESDEELDARQMAGINALISISDVDSVLYDRQVEGIRALIAIANEVATATTSRELIVSPTGEIRKQSRLSVISKLRKDEMTWNSLFLIMNTGLMAGTGFLFWIVTTRLFSLSDVGKGTALISGASLIAQLALLGLNMGMNRFLPAARNRDALISSGLALVAAAGAVGAIIYILLTPLIAPTLAFVSKNLLLTIGFAGATGAIAVNTLTDNIFIALRKAKYTVLVDGVIGGFGKVALAFLVAGAGAYGLFLASSIALVLASTASLLLIFIAMRVRVDLREPLKALKPLLRFSGANYVASLVNLVVGLANSLILLDRLGAPSAAIYFVVLQMVQIMYTAGIALEQTFLTEGSQVGADIPQLRRRALRLLALFFVASATIMIGIGRWLLLAFGHEGAYYHHGYTTLIILVLAAGPLSVSSWFQTILRLAGKLRAIVVVNVTWALLSCAGVWFGSSFGLTGVACGSVSASLIAVFIAGVAARERRT
jgi:O-antigen/teichoic acid export membrane protein